MEHCYGISWLNGFELLNGSEETSSRDFFKIMGTSRPLSLSCPDGVLPNTLTKPKVGGVPRSTLKRYVTTAKP